MSTFSPIDLSLLPAPDVLELIDFEQLLAERKAYLVSLYPVDQQAELAARLQLESDPLTKLLQEQAYREMVLRQRINDATRASMLAYAKRNDLDNLGALLNVERLVLVEADPAANPPVAAIYEEDERYRSRIQLSLEGFSTAGPVGAYTFHALSSSAQVKDVSITSHTAGIVTVTVLSTQGDGVPIPDLLTTVNAALNDEDVRPLCDTVEVVPATVVPYQVTAELIFYSGPDMALVKAAAEAAVQQYVTGNHRLGYDITRSGLFAALHQPGVQNVLLTSPVADVVISNSEAAFCTAINITGNISDA